MVRQYKQPMFQRRHYENIARTLGHLRASDGVVKVFSDQFAKDNPGFKPERFRSYVEKHKTHRPKKK